MAHRYSMLVGIVRLIENAGGLGATRVRSQPSGATWNHREPGEQEREVHWRMTVKAEFAR